MYTIGRAYYFIVFFSCLNLLAACQVRELQEEDLDFNILKWHYNHYPKTLVSWEHLKSNDSEVLRAEFIFKGYPTIAFYTSNGELISEEVDLSKNVPVSILHYLDETYEKYRVISFLRITDVKTANVSFQLEIKSKKEGYRIIGFDDHLIPKDSITLYDGE